MSNKHWNEADTRKLVRRIENCSDPVAAACAVSGAVVAVLLHHGESEIAKALADSMIKTVVESQRHDPK